LLSLDITRKRGKAQRVARPACTNATVHLLLTYRLVCYCQLANDLKTSAQRILAYGHSPPNGTHINEPQDLRSYWTKVHEMFTRHRGIIVDVNETIGVAIFSSVVKTKCTLDQSAAAEA